MLSALWAFVKGINKWPADSPQKANNAELLCFCCCENCWKSVQLPAIWYAMIRMWRQCNDYFNVNTWYLKPDIHGLTVEVSHSSAKYVYIYFKADIHGLTVEVSHSPAKYFYIYSRSNSQAYDKWILLMCQRSSIAITPSAKPNWINKMSCSRKYCDPRGRGNIFRFWELMRLIIEVWIN